MNYANFLPTFFKVFSNKNNPPLWRDKAGLLLNKRGLSDREIILAEVFAAGRQLVVYQRGQHFFELQEESLAGLIAIGIHVEVGFKLQVAGFKLVSHFLRQQRG